MFYIKRDSTNRAFRKRCVKGDGTAIDLSEAQSVRFIMADAKGAMKVDGACSVINATTGEIEYAWQAGDTDTSGTYRAEIQITFSDGRIETVPSRGYEHIEIQDDLRP